MPNHDLDLFKSSFFGPWVPQAGQAQRVKHHYLSIAHWYESAKFMPAHPELRDAVLFCPTVKEARKFAKARQALWRSDWNLIRHSVLIAGLGFLALDRPDLALQTRLKSELMEDLGAMALPERFLEGCIDRFQQWSAGPSVGTFGANSAPDGVVGRKMSKVVQNKPSWTLVSLCNNRTAWRLHDWALAHYVPVRYVGSPDKRTTSSLISEFIAAVDQLVVFEAKGGRRADSVIQLARLQKKNITLELYQPEDLSTVGIGSSLE